MKTRHVQAALAFCVAVLACAPASGSSREPSDRVPRPDLALSTEDHSSSLAPAISWAGLSAPPGFPSAMDAQWLRKGDPGMVDRLTMRLLASDSLARSIATEIARLNESTPRDPRFMGLRQQGSSGNRNWIQRHPVLFGTLVGFGTGFLIGYLPGDDAIFEDFTAEFNGLVLGGIGAGAGALVGWGVSR
jgi:hypothetical protein